MGIKGKLTGDAARLIKVAVERGMTAQESRKRGMVETSYRQGGRSRLPQQK
jgi:hypothetical protein